MTQRPLATLLSYSHLNQEQRRKLREHFVPLERAGLIRVWDDRDLLVGQEVDASIGAKLEETEVFILLVSRDFLESTYCSGIEMKRALERHAEGSALILPIVLEPCGWKDSPLQKLVVAPTDGRPISEWPAPEAGWSDAANLIWASLLAFRQKRRARKWLPVAAGVTPVLLVAAGVAFQLQASRWEHPKQSPASPATMTSRNDTSTQPAASSLSSPAVPPPQPTAKSFRPAGSLIELTVISDPPGMIMVRAGDRTPSGPSPLTIHLSPGPVEIEVSRAGEQAFNKHESFEVKPSPREQQYVVKVGKGAVQFNSRPAAHVTVDGVLHFDVPDQRDLYEGEHTAVFECDRRTFYCADKKEGIRSFMVKPGKISSVIHLWE